MNNNTIIDILSLIKQIPESTYHTLNDEFLVARLGYNESLEFLKYPTRFNGFIALFCLEGNLQVDINLRSYKVSEGSLIIYTPGNIVKVSDADKTELSELQFILVACTEPFITGVRMDFDKLYIDSLLALENPCIVMDSQERMLMRQYLELAETLLIMDLPNKAEAVKSLGTSIFYLLGTFWKNKIDTVSEKKTARMMRANIVFERFLSLVAEHHNKEKKLAFYADKLYLTQKYLSTLIKTLSGRNATEWIDAFLILDTKNLLKYSDMSIKEIAFEMSFASVPSFYKFFNKMTGMTPLEYRKS